MRPQEGTEEGSGKRRVLYSAALEAGGTPCRATWEGCQGAQQAQDRSWGRYLGSDLYWGFCRKGKAGQGGQTAEDWRF